MSAHAAASFPKASWKPGVEPNLVSPFAYLAADSADSSDLEDDIILSLNE